MTTFHPCFLIPCYNHGKTVPAVIDGLAEFGFPVIIVDDGSRQETKAILAEQAQREHVTLVTLAENQGKGGAVIAGIEEAYRQSFTHAIQIDADGQHDLDALPKLIDDAQANPTSLISGCPVYDESVPKSRLYGRYATHIWVWIETLSTTIKDSMCGFRAYPIGRTVKVLERNQIGKRMDFDIEILVRMYWDGCDIRFIDTKVIYPEDGLSHFDALWDNIKISAMHTRLFFGMLPRIPRLLKRRQQNKTNQTESAGSLHWSKQKEQGTVIGIKILMQVYALFGRRAFAALLKLVIGYYYLTNKHARQVSADYLERVVDYANEHKLPLPDQLNSYQHLLSFGYTMLDKLAGWRGDLSIDNITLHGSEYLAELRETKQGIVILGSHLGNLELCRALSREYSDIKINALVFTEHAERFNSVMKAINPDSALNLIQVSTLGPDTAILLQQKLEQGEWVVIVGDRTSTTQEQRAVWADFLGKPAPFPQGPFMLANVLKAPVYLLFGLRDESQREPHFNVYFEKFTEQMTLPRRNRTEALEAEVRRYADRLAHYTMKAPLQWHNYFNFWQLSDKKD
ncbi:acyltransferase [Photobacterium jeanii]|uniref:Acyltransferase n=1 Tax=Photobacterium jeanii TaxID=858640 RepID=A0A178K162_9GAMM|nr:glycosyltransferase family 2 protein [Photobacterium jeanii]OAN11011.1 acyltransferase [Photobacterium jeanii]PST90526.1 glycosyltransferase family 2 protein [Photobacterium jeanii]